MSLFRTSSSLLTENNQNLRFSPERKSLEWPGKVGVLGKAGKKGIFPIFLSTKLLQKQILGEVFPSAPLFQGRKNSWDPSALLHPRHRFTIPGLSHLEFRDFFWSHLCQGGRPAAKNCWEWKKGRKIPKGRSRWEKCWKNAMEWWENTMESSRRSLIQDCLEMQEFSEINLLFLAIRGFPEL